MTNTRYTISISAGGGSAGRYAIWDATERRIVERRRTERAARAICSRLNERERAHRRASSPPAIEHAPSDLPYLIRDRASGEELGSAETPDGARLGAATLSDELGRPVDWLERRDRVRFVDRAYNRMPCGCPLDSGCDGYHSIV